jgi:methionyl-tRNA formyltransferase
MAKVVFMGSAEFSVPSLLALTMAHEVVGVVTQPDRPTGRGRKVAPNPVKRMVEAAGIPLFQPESLRSPEAVARLAEWEFEVIVVAAFGQILRRPVLEMTPNGCLNVHASLLPCWRGAAPIPASILAGDEETGVTIMKMDPGMDTGPILAQQTTSIEIDDTTATLLPRLAELGAQLLVEVLPLYLDGYLTPQAQPETGVTYAPQLVKADGRIDWSLSAAEIDRRVRAYTPWPGAFTFWKGTRLKVLDAIPIPDWSGAEPPGSVVEGDVSPLVATGEGGLWLTRVQLAGKKAMAAETFMRGQGEFVGSVLDDSSDDQAR